MFDPRINVNLVVALMIEAKGFIDRFKLSPDNRHTAFKIYGNGNVNLIVSGIGRNNAAAATAYLGAQSASQQGVPMWINAGIAGHHSLPVGELVIAHKILERASGSTFYPQVYPLALTSTLLTTVDTPETTYKEQSAFDMEASGFAAAASRFSSLELVQSVKVISDNASAGVETVSNQSIEALMQSCVSPVIELIEVMLPPAAHRVAQAYLPKSFDEIAQAARFSATQMVQLKRLCQRYSALGLEGRLAEIAARDIQSAKAIIQQLDAGLQQPMGVS